MTEYKRAEPIIQLLPQANAEPQADMPLHVRNRMGRGPPMRGRGQRINEDNINVYARNNNGNVHDGNIHHIINDNVARDNIEHMDSGQFWYYISLFNWRLVGDGPIFRADFEYAINQIGVGWPAFRAMMGEMEELLFKIIRDKAFPNCPDDILRRAVSHTVMMGRHFFYNVVENPAFLMYYVENEECRSLYEEYDVK